MIKAIVCLVFGIAATVLVSYLGAYHTANPAIQPTVETAEGKLPLPYSMNASILSINLFQITNGPYVSRSRLKSKERRSLKIFARSPPSPTSPAPKPIDASPRPSQTSGAPTNSSV